MSQNNLSTAAALTQTFSSESTSDLHRAAVLLRLLNRNYEDELQNNLTAKIPNPNYNVLANPRTAPTDAWQAGNQAQIEYLEHTITDTPIEVASKVDYRALRRTPIDYMTRLREKQLRTINTSLEDTVLTALDAATLTAFDFGTATTAFIAPDGEITGTGVDKYIRSALSKYTVAMRRASAIGPTALTPIGGQLGGMWCVIQPELYEIFADELLEAGYSLDSLTEGLLQRGSVFTSEDFSGTFRRVTIIETPALKLAATARKWIFYMGVPKAIAFSQIPGPVLLLPPDQNQSEPGWRLNQIVDYALTIIQPALVRRVTIHQK